MNESKEITIQISLISLMIIGSSRSGKTNVLINLIKHQRPDIDKKFFIVKDPFESKKQTLINE